MIKEGSRTSGEAWAQTEREGSRERAPPSAAPQEGWTLERRRRKLPMTSPSSEKDGAVFYKSRGGDQSVILFA